MKNTLANRVLICAGILGVAAPAWAQSAPEVRIEADPPAARDAGSVPRPGDPGRIYLRGSIGVGSLHGTVDHPDDELDGSLGAETVTLELLAGATIARGLAVGWALSLDVAPEPHVSLWEAKRQKTDPTGLVMVGGFVDAYPGRSGFHFGSTLGLAALFLPSDVYDPDAQDEDDPYGVGLGASVFTGWDFRLADGWALGLGVRAFGAYTTSEDDDETRVDVGTQAVGGASFSVGVSFR